MTIPTLEPQPERRRGRCVMTGNCWMCARTLRTSERFALTIPTRAAVSICGSCTKGWPRADLAIETPEAVVPHRLTHAADGTGYLRGLNASTATNEAETNS